jgi:hypothetical protein
MVYRDTGTTLPAQDPNFSWVTRRMFLGGEGGEVRINEVYSYIGSTLASGGVDMNLLTLKTNDDAGEVTQTVNTVLVNGRKLSKWQFRQMCEGVRVSAVLTGNPNQAMAQDYVLMDGDGYGQEDSGK